MNIRTALEQAGFANLGVLHHNLTVAQLYEHALFLEEGALSAQGALVVSSGTYTTYASSDTFITDEPSTSSLVAWNEFNQPLQPEAFAALKARIAAYMQARDMYVQDCFAGSSPKYRLSVRFVSELAWHSLFVQNLFVQPDEQERPQWKPEFTVVCVPSFKAVPAIDSTRSEAFVAINFAEKIILIGGTAFAGEIKRAVFRVMTMLMPARRVLPMRCAVNIGAKGDVALFFGRTGTGKTTLSAASERRLVGDDEHGWADEGIFNFEGGCYPSLTDVKQQEPNALQSVVQIPSTVSSAVSQMIRSFGTIIENATLHTASRQLATPGAPALSSAQQSSAVAIARAAYKREQLRLLGDVIVPSNKAPHARHLVFLTCDATGVLPPIARLTPEQAVFFFLCGYTSRASDGSSPTGTASDVASFSPCFGEQFMAQAATVYASLLRERLRKNKTTVWLLNTGWTASITIEQAPEQQEAPAQQPSKSKDRRAANQRKNIKTHQQELRSENTTESATKLQRISLVHTRAMLKAALNGELESITYVTEPFFNLSIPKECPNVPAELLLPRNVWKSMKEYDAKARELHARFLEHYERRFAQVMDASILAALAPNRTRSSQQPAPQTSNAARTAKQHEHKGQEPSEQQEPSDNAVGTKSKTSAKTASKKSAVHAEHGKKQSGAQPKQSPESLFAELPSATTTPLSHKNSTSKRSPKSPSKSSSKSSPQPSPQTS